MTATAKIHSPAGPEFTLHATAKHHYERQSWECPGEDWVEPIKLTYLYVLLPQVEIELDDEVQITDFLTAWGIDVEDVDDWEMDDYADSLADAEAEAIDRAYEAYRDREDYLRV